MVRPKNPSSAILGTIAEVDGLAAVPLDAVRDRLLVEELAGDLAEAALLVGEAEVHGRPHYDRPAVLAVAWTLRRRR